MRLIIAEKHSVARSIAEAFGGTGHNGDGCIEIGNDIVTWAQGHLVNLATPDEYEERGWSKWSMEALPIDPTPDWKWNISHMKGASRQYGTIARLLRRDDVDEIVNACDPDREGEAIFRRIVNHAGVKKPVRRLWVVSLEEEAIREAFATMKPGREYDGLAASEIRAKADWLIGLNSSRAYSLATTRASRSAASRLPPSR